MTEAQLRTLAEETLGIKLEGAPGETRDVSLAGLNLFMERLFAECARTGLAGDRSRQRAGFFRQLIDSLPDYIYFKDCESRFLFSNPAHIRHLGCSSLDEVIGKSDLDFFQEPFARAKIKDERRIIETGEGWAGREEHHVQRDGTESWAMSTKLPLLDENGEIAGIFGISRDITEKKMTELELERQRVLLDTIVQILPCSLFVRDRDDRFLLINEEYRRNLGIEQRGEVVGKSLEDCFPDEDTEPVEAEDEAIMSSGKGIFNQVSFDTSFLHDQRWVSTSKVPLRKGEGEVEGLVGITWDITEQKQAEERARKAYEELSERTRQMEAELEVARMLQQRLISEGLDEEGRFEGAGTKWALEASFLYEPSHHLAGDFFHVSRHGSSRFGILMCDVMGHGVKASLVTMLIRGMFQDANRLTDRPAEVLGHLNRGLAIFAEDPLFPRFVTALYLLVDLDEGWFEYANAGHPEPIVFRGTELIIPHGATRPGIALGLLPDEKYQTTSMEMDDTTRIAVFSDGLVEIEDGDDWYDRSRLESDLTRTSGQGVEEQLASIEKALKACGASSGQMDDICLVLLELARQ